MWDERSFDTCSFSAASWSFGDTVPFPQYVTGAWPDYLIDEHAIRGTGGSMPILLALRAARRRGW